MSNKPYVFISYAHLDSDAVLPCLEAMGQSDISLWYDEGIEAGSEWPEYIAQKVIDCDKFVLFMSKGYLNSVNCKRELNFAISRKKDILTIFVEDVQLSPGVEMQLGPYQAIHSNRFNTTEAFHHSLSCEPFFDSCRPNNNSSSLHSEVNVPPVPTPVSEKKPSSKKRVTTALLAIFLGSFGIHRFYLQHIGRGILYLLLCWTYIPALVSFIEGLIFLFMKDSKFNEKYNQ